MDTKLELEKIAQHKKDITVALADNDVKVALMEKTFPGFTLPLVQQALFSGALMGFSIKDFLVRNIYAVKFGNSFTLIIAINHARKIGQKNGIVGSKEPVFEYETNSDGTKKIVSCSVTVLKNINGYIGEFTSKVFFSEFNSGKQNWVKMPAVMISKVAEMHSLRKACPEDLSEVYSEEELDNKTEPVEVTGTETISADFQEKINACKTVEELNTLYRENKTEAQKFISKFGERKEEILNGEIAIDYGNEIQG